MQTSFFNTNNSKGDQLTIAKQQAEFQEIEILKIFKSFPKSKFPTSVIGEIMSANFNPILPTSLRRGITNLTKSGQLIRSEKACVMGNYGKMVNVWYLNTSAIC